MLIVCTAVSFKDLRCNENGDSLISSSFSKMLHPELLVPFSEILSSHAVPHWNSPTFPHDELSYLFSEDDTREPVLEFQNYFPMHMPGLGCLLEPPGRHGHR
jgi:hypothetical protein